MKCTVIGLGYIGLPTAALLASKGHKVIGVDINREVISTINKGEIHIIEEGLERLVFETINNGSFKATANPETSDVFLIAVPTPLKKNGDKIPIPNISYVLAAVESICNVIKKGDLVLIESTSPVGTTEKVAEKIKNLTGLDKDAVNIAYCPERVIPGATLKELVQNDRVVGGLTITATQKASSFYSSFCQGKILETNSRTSELVKLTENAFRDVNLAFANEISMVCDQLDVKVTNLVKLANHHPRVNILNPGCGVGGHCIAVDPLFIAHSLSKSTELIQKARKINIKKTKWVIEKVVAIATKIKLDLGRAPKIGCLGLTYKPNVDDLRESPALFITRELIKLKLNILPCDPNVKKLDNLALYNLEKVIDESDFLVFLTAHKEFSDLNFLNYKYFDACGITSL